MVIKRIGVEDTREYGLEYEDRVALATLQLFARRRCSRDAVLSNVVMALYMECPICMRGCTERFMGRYGYGSIWEQDYMTQSGPTNGAMVASVGLRGLVYVMVICKTCINYNGGNSMNEDEQMQLFTQKIEEAENHPNKFRSEKPSTYLKNYLIMTEPKERIVDMLNPKETYAWIEE